MFSNSINSTKLWCSITLFSFVLLLAACQTTTSGTGLKTSNKSPSKGSIEVLDISFTDAFALAATAAQNAYQDVRVSNDGSQIIINNRSVWKGDAQAFVDTILVKEHGAVLDNAN